jgi:hypothetical protein
LASAGASAEREISESTSVIARLPQCVPFIRSSCRPPPRGVLVGRPTHATERDCPRATHESSQKVRGPDQKHTRCE